MDLNQLRDARHNTPLHCAIEGAKGDAEDTQLRIRIVKLLLQAGADAGARNKDGRTAVDLVHQNTKLSLPDKDDFEDALCGAA